MVAVEEEDVGGAAVAVREFDGDRDSAAVERLERACEVGPSGGKVRLFTDLLGDPLCRVRHSPAYLMLVAKAAGGAGVVGVVRGCVKTVACGRGELVAKVAYLLGLRVSAAHRRRGIGRALVERMEEWFRRVGAEYAYVATEAGNEPSVRLFTARCGYAKFRTPSVLVHPVFRHDLAPPRGAAVVELAPREAELLYRRRLAGVEFFPRDIDAVLSNPLSLGTFLALPEKEVARWRGVEAFLAAPPESWAVASVWNCKDAFRAVAAHPVRAQPLRAVRGALPLRPRRRARRGHRGRRPRPAPRRGAALAAPRRRGPLVHQAPRRRLRRRRARRLDQGAARRLHLRRPKRVLAPACVISCNLLVSFTVDAASDGP